MEPQETGDTGSGIAIESPAVDEIIKPIKAKVKPQEQPQNPAASSADEFNLKIANVEVKISDKRPCKSSKVTKKPV